MQDQEFSRRSALLRAVSVLGAGLLVSKNALGQKDATLAQKIDFTPSPEFECTFYITNIKLKMASKPMAFTVKLPLEMVEALTKDPFANVQMKFWATHIKGEVQPKEWGAAQIKLRQSVIQSKGFMVQDKWHTLQEKVNPVGLPPSPVKPPQS